MKNLFTDEDYMLWRLLTQTRNAIMKARARELSEYDLSPREASILLTSLATNGKASPFKIARWVINEPHSISECVSRMARSGLVKKVQNPDARKSISIELTEKGRRASHKAAELQSVHKIMSSLSDRQQQQLKGILKILRDTALKEIGVKAPLPFPP